MKVFVKDVRVDVMNGLASLTLQGTDDRRQFSTVFVTVPISSAGQSMKAAEKAAKSESARLLRVALTALED